MHEFNVGDVVKVRDCDSMRESGDPDFIGEVGVVINLIDDDFWPIEVEFENDVEIDSEYFSPMEIELVEN